MSNLDSSNESYMKIEREVRSSMRATERSSQIGNRKMERIERELQHLRRQCAQLEEAVESCAEEKRRFEEQSAQMRLRRVGEGAEISFYVTFFLGDNLRPVQTKSPQYGF